MTVIVRGNAYVIKMHLMNENIQTVASKEKDCAERFYVFPHLNMWSLTCNMPFLHISWFCFLFKWQICPEVDHKTGIKRAIAIFTLILLRFYVVLYFMDFSFFIFYFVWFFYVFNFKCNISTMSWSIVNLQVHSYTDLQSPYNFSFAATLFPNILPTVIA